MLDILELFKITDELALRVSDFSLFITNENIIHSFIGNSILGLVVCEIILSTSIAAIPWSLPLLYI